MKIICFLVILFVGVVCAARRRDPACYQPAKTGPCFAYFPRYAYNCKTGKCEQFVYGGCQGNDNNFQTKKECCNACNCKC